MLGDAYLLCLDEARLDDEGVASPSRDFCQEDAKDVALDSDLGSVVFVNMLLCRRDAAARRLERAGSRLLCLCLLVLQDGELEVVEDAAKLRFVELPVELQIPQLCALGECLNALDHVRLEPLAFVGDQLVRDDAKLAECHDEQLLELADLAELRIARVRVGRIA